MEGGVVLEYRRAEQPAVDRCVEREIRIAGMEVGDTLDRGGSRDRDGPPVAQLVLSVPNKGLVARNHDGRSPPLRARAEQPELEREQRGIALCNGDVSVDSVYKSLHDRRPAGVIVT